jgi:hypothetical protein
MSRSNRLGSILLALLIASGASQPAEAQSWRSMSSSRSVQGEDRVDVHVEYGAGGIELTRGNGRRLYEFELRYDEEVSRPLVEYEREGKRLRLGLEGIEGRGATIKRGSGSAGHAAVKLSPTVPMSLTIRFGAGEANLDLGGISLSSVDLATGASETSISFSSPNRVAADHVRIRSGAAAIRAESLGNSGAAVFEYEGGVGETVLDFGGQWRRDATGTVKLGMGSLRLRFPRDLGVRLTRTAFLTSFKDDGLERRGSEYYSEGWDRATHRLTLHVTAAVGAIEVEWID